jgi:RND superfamily putative drug exporter
MHRQVAGSLTGRTTKWIVLLFWIVVVAGLGGFAGKLTGVLDNQAKSWLPGNAESTKALDKLAPFQSPDSIPTVIVYEAKSGKLTPANLADAKAATVQIQDLKGVDGKVVGPIPSQDGEVAQTIVNFNLGKDGWNKLPDTVKELRKVAGVDGTTLHVAGQGGQAADSAEAFKGLDGSLLYTTVGVVIIILLLTYRSPILWLLPVISAGVALTVAQAVIYFLAKDAGLTVNGQSQGILTVLVFGAGTDYALLLVARYREELRRHEDRHEAMAFALHRAAPAIIASAATVVLGMLCLLFAEMNSTAGLGPVAAIGIGIGLLVMITLLPALLVICGRWIFWPARPTYGTPEPSASGFWSKVGRRISIRPRTVWVGTSVVLLIACAGLFKLNANGLSTEDSYTKEFDSIVGQKVLTKHGLADQSNPVMVLANADKAAEVQKAMTGITGLSEPSRPLVKGGVAFISAPTTDDATSEAAFATVDRVRSAVHAVGGADALVGGGPAVLLDIRTASDHDNLVIIPAVLIVVLLILMLLLRAVVAPVILIATVVLSFGASLGLSALLFRYGFGFAGADSSLPLFVFVFLVALGIDYNIFLMTRVREETPQFGTRRAALIALSATGGVITSAGLVLASTFLVLGTMPLVAFAEIGVAVALGVILDTMIVRSILVTALNLDVGGKMWWPSSLDRTSKDVVTTEEPALDAAR